MRGPKKAFTLVELLVSIAVIGLLVGLLMPAIQNAREAMRMTQCKNHLHQISLGVEMFEHTYGAFPPARYQPRPGDPAPHDCGGKETTWLVRIMPFIEQTAKHDDWDFSKQYVDHSTEVRTGIISTYLCPSRRGAGDAVGSGLLTASTTTFITLPCGCTVPMTSTGSVTVEGAVGDYGGNHGDLSPGSFGLPTDFYFGGNGTGVIISSRAECQATAPMDWIDRISRRHLRDGASHTILAGEMHVPIGKLGRSPQDAFIYNGDQAFNSTRVGGPSVPIASDLRSEGNSLVAWGSWHRGLCHFAMCDGSTRGISTSVDTETLGQLCNRRDGETVVLP